MANKDEDIQCYPETPAVIGFSCIIGGLLIISQLGDNTPGSPAVFTLFAGVLAVAVAAMKYFANENREAIREQRTLGPR